MLHRGGLIYAGVRDPAGLSDEFDGLPAEVIPLDVTDLATVQAAAEDGPEVNLLVNNAGLFTNKRLVLTDDPAAARREMEVNYCWWPAPSRRRSWAAIPRPRRRRSSCPPSHGPSWQLRAGRHPAGRARGGPQGGSPGYRPIRYERGMTKLLKATTMDTGR